MSGRGGASKPSLYVRNLSSRMTPDDLYDAFTRFGKIKDIHVPVDYYTGTPRGFGFVEFYDWHDAEDAQEGMDGRDLDGKRLEITFAQSSRRTPDEMRAKEGDGPPTGGGKGADAPARWDRDDGDRGRGRDRDGGRGRTKGRASRSPSRSRSRGRNRSPPAKRRRRSRSRSRPSKKKHRRSRSSSGGSRRSRTRSRRRSSRKRSKTDAKAKGAKAAEPNGESVGPKPRFAAAVTEAHDPYDGDSPPRTPLRSEERSH